MYIICDFWERVVSCFVITHLFFVGYIFIWIGFIFGGTKKITFQEPQTPDAVVKSHDNFYNIFYLFSVKPSILNPKVETLAVPD